MSWRTVVIASRCKLDYKMGFMVVRAEETKKIFLDEIAVLLIENPAVALTGCLLEALVAKKIRVIFCDMRSYFSDEEMELFTESACLHDFEVLLLESVAAPRLSHTKRFVIDSDLCEF